MTSYSDLAGTNLVATTDYGYDGAGDVTNIQSYNAGSTPLTSDQYQYNSVGQLTQSNNSETGGTTTYSYDAAGHCCRAAASYNYDANGNRDAASDTVGPDNELLSDGVWNYTYNKEGDLVEKISTTTASTGFIPTTLRTN